MADDQISLDPLLAQPAAAAAAAASIAPPAESLASSAVHSMFWSLVQNWGGRMLNFVQFVILAHFLSPGDFGLAAAAAIITLLINSIAELGFSDAIIQRPGLERDDVNLPFYVAMGSAVALAVTAALLAHRIEGWLHVPGLARVVMALSFTTPVTTFSLFQESMYKRHLQFRGLAFRIMIANVLATCVSVPCAIAGLGVWSLVIQSWLVVTIGAAWVWRRPLWTPGRTLRPRAFREMSRFGSSILAMRLLDFGSTRTVEVLMIGRFGVRPYGFYTASAKLNQTLMDLLQAALNDVSLTLLSKIAGERERLAAVYRKSITIAGNLVPPVFILVAALSQEICAVLFDRRWDGIYRIAGPLFVLGAVQSLQFFSRPYLSARGRSEVVLVISVAKFLLVLAALELAPSHDLRELVLWFVAAQLLSAPISFAVTARELKVPYFQIYRDLAPIAAACVAAALAVAGCRPFIAGPVHSPLLIGILLGFLFAIVYAVVILLIGRRQFMTVVEFGLGRLREKKRRG